MSKMGTLRLSARTCSRPPSTAMMKSKFLKCRSVLGVQDLMKLSICSLNGVVEMRKRPLPSAPTIDVLISRLVNLYLRIWTGWHTVETKGFLLARAECPYIQFRAGHITGVSSLEGITNW